MPLTHVCMWSDHGWKQVTTVEVAALHPEGTVSAQSGLFFCELCGQYVTLTDGEIRDRYFKHSAYEKSKNCPERTFAYGTTDIPTFLAGKHNLPIRLNIFNGTFQLEVGLIPAPSEVIMKYKNQSLTIQGVGQNENAFVFSLDRLQEGTVTYFSVGQIPAPRYRLEISLPIPNISQYWPSIISGIDADGVFFDGITRKKLPLDADVQINHSYFLLMRGCIRERYEHVKIKEVIKVIHQWECWRLYQITATAFTEDAAKFFLEFHARLTDTPVQIYPIWPAFVRNPYLIYHNTDDVFVFMQGDVKSKLFPLATMNKYDGTDASLLTIQCKERQQLLSVGRAEVLKYTYLWKIPLTMTGTLPKIEIIDIAGNVMREDIYHQLPQQKAVKIKAQFDGSVVIERDNFQEIRYELHANESLILDVHMGQTVFIYQGLDCVRTVSFKKETSSTITAESDQRLYDRLRRCNGEQIPVPHSLGALCLKLDGYPKTKAWLYQKIRENQISFRTLAILKSSFYIRIRK